MIATGTDIKPLECLVFMRTVKSRGLFEQMKGRGVRVIPDADFQAVTPDAATKTHFALVDAVGVLEERWEAGARRPSPRAPEVYAKSSSSASQRTARVCRSRLPTAVSSSATTSAPSSVIRVRIE